MVADTKHRWNIPLPYNADLLFAYVCDTAASLDGWIIIKADQANRLVQISPKSEDANLAIAESRISIRGLYRTAEKSELELILETIKPVESKDALSTYPIETIFRLDGKGLIKTVEQGVSSLGDPLSKTLVWHLRSRGQGINWSEVRPYLRELLGPGADMIFEEALSKVKDERFSEDENKDKENSKS